MKDNLLKFIPEAKLEELKSIGRIKQIKAGDYFIREGQVPSKLGLVKSGLFRYLYINDKGDEFTKGIIIENEFITSYSAMVMRSPSYFFIEALEDSEILEFDFERWQKLRDEDPFWDSLLVRVLEKAFIAKEQREREFLLLDARTRYENFCKNYAEVEPRLKQHIIASYLGIQPESLSRIKKKQSP